jgi:hypothetical protein
VRGQEVAVIDAAIRRVETAGLLPVAVFRIPTRDEYASFKRRRPVSAGSSDRSKRFYEKVVKVKADVAAILNFFLPISQI